MSTGKALVVETGCVSESQKGIPLSPQTKPPIKKREPSTHTDEQQNTASQSCEQLTWENNPDLMSPNVIVEQAGSFESQTEEVAFSQLI